MPPAPAVRSASTRQAPSGAADQVGGIDLQQRRRAGRSRQGRRKPGLANTSAGGSRPSASRRLRARRCRPAPPPAAARAGPARPPVRRTRPAGSGSGTGSQRQAPPGRRPGSTLATPSSSKARSSRRAALGQAAVAEGGEGAEHAAPVRSQPAAAVHHLVEAGHGADAITGPAMGGSRTWPEFAELRAVLSPAHASQAKRRRSSVRGCSAPIARARLGHRRPACGRTGRSATRRRASASLALTGKVS